MGSAVRAIVILVSAAAVGACTLPPLPSSSPSPTPSPTATPTATPPPTPTPTPAAEPTPDPAAIPAFTAGDVIATRIDGLRVRRLPGTNQPIVTGLLPLGNELVVVMGPIVVDEFGWYLVRDADTASGPGFEEGWLAAGSEPEPFLGSAGRTADDHPYAGSFANVGDAEYGPIQIVDEYTIIRWFAVDPERVRCTFRVELGAGSRDPVRAISATIGATAVPGTLQRTFFDQHERLRGQVFVTVTSDCAWSLVIQRVPAPDESPSPSATDGDS